MRDWDALAGDGLRSSDRTVDKRRLGRLVGLLPPEIMRQVDDAIRLHLDL